MGAGRHYPGTDDPVVPCSAVGLLVVSGGSGTDRGRPMADALLLKGAGKGDGYEGDCFPHASVSGKNSDQAAAIGRFPGIKPGRGA